MTRLAAPDILDRWPAPFAPCFTRSGWRNALVLAAGAILAPGRRTVVASALRAVGLGGAAGLTNFHRVLNRNAWRGRWLACRLLDALVRAFVPDGPGPVVVGIDATLERRWEGGAADPGAGHIYRDPVRASHQHFIKASGLRWRSLMLLVPVPWAKRVWAPPFLTVLAPSERYARAHGRRHKSLADRARQGLLQLARWLPGREIVAVGDNGYAVIELLAAVRRHVCMITRLRLDARLFDPAPARRPGTMGRPRVVGRRQPNLAARLDDPATGWRRLRASGWYRGEDRELGMSTAAPRSGTTPACRRCRSATSWSATRAGSSGRRHSCAPAPTPTRSTCCAGSSAAGRPRSRSPRSGATSAWRRSGGGRTRRSRAHHAEPARAVLVGGAVGGAHELHAAGRLRPRQASWHVKERATCGDALAAVRRYIWTTAPFPTSADPPELAEVPRGLLNAPTAAACYPA